MGLKVLGLICAGVFFGAAILEVKQLGWGKKKRGEDGDDGEAEPPPDQRGDRD